MDKKLNNIALCYHGMTSNKSEKSSYTTYIEDFKEQILHLENRGYKFVKPYDFYRRYNTLTKPSTPIATIIFDDALESVSLATVWLADKSIPFGIAVIGQRLGKLTPETGYAAWRDINTAIESGLCEILHHTYNLHHFCLIKEGNKILNSPILEGPCQADNGEFIYITANDTRRYWDLAHNNLAWGFPILGTDIKTGELIKSTVTFEASRDLSVDRIRMLACLHNPYGSGYAVKTKISINNTEVANSVIEPVQYEIRSQWPEREFITISLKKKYDIKKGNSYNIEFETQNTGNAALMIYAIPEFSGKYKLSSSCTEMTFPENISWPARAGIILADGNGKTVSTSEFLTYVKDDLAKNNQVINKYLNASWKTWSTGYQESDKLSTVVLGGTYSSGEPAVTKIFIRAKEAFTAEILKFKYAGRLGNQYPLIIDIFINDDKVGRFEANWWDWHWQEVEINSYNFIENKDYVIKFETRNASPFGQGLVRVYMDQPKPPQPTWNTKINRIIVPSESDLAHETLYEVTNPEGSDVYPDGAVVGIGSNFKWILNKPYDGPGKVFLEILSCSAGKVKTPKQICYPFGAYYSTTITSLLLQEKEDIHPEIKSILNGLGINSGFAVWDNPVSSLKNVNLKYSEYIMPRYLVEGTTELTKVLKNIDSFIGFL